MLQRALATQSRSFVPVFTVLATVTLGTPATVDAHSGSGLSIRSSIHIPLLSLSVPATVTGGARVVATGTATRAPRGAQVFFQWQRRKQWVSLGRATVVHDRFKLSVLVPSGQSVLRVRAIVLTGRRRLAVSAIRKLTVRVPRHGLKAAGPITIAPAAIPSPLTPSTPSAPGPGEPASPGPIKVTAPAVTVASGSVVYVGTPEPVKSIATIGSSPSGAAPGVSVSVAGGELAVVASAQSSPGTMTLAVSGTGCTASECERAIEIQIPVTVAPIKAPEGPLESFTIPAPERVAEAQNHDLTDELLITMGTAEAPGTRAQAEATAAAAGGVVAGGLEEAGIYQVRWPYPQNLASRRGILETQSGVTAVSFSTVEAYGEASAGYPVAEEFDQPEWTWPYEQVDASQAWSLATGSHVKVGVIDEGDVYTAHEDLHVEGIIGPGPYSPRFHATHVAGLACAKNNNAENGGPQLGMVGMAWGCPIVSTGVEYAKNSNAAMLSAMREMIERPSVKVVNISMGRATNGCGNQQAATALAKWVADEKRPFDQLLAGIGKNIVWTFAAGNNCLPATASPWAANSQLPNVITVAATNSDNGLASFSDYGPEVTVAAPGGVHIDPETKGLMSTAMDGDCPFFDACPIWCDSELSYCGTYNQDTGTSMAAPIVAGIAALVRERAPRLTADEAGECITSTASFDGAHADVRDDQPTYKEFSNPLYAYDYSTPIVDAEAAVECASGWPTKVEAPAVFDNDFHNPPQVGDTLFATTGSWTHYPTSFNYKWEVCAPSTPCSPVGSGGSAATYVIPEGDLGDTLRAVVSAENHAGVSASVSTAQTETIVTATSTSPWVAMPALGPTEGPAGLLIPYDIPECTVPPGTIKIFAEYVDHQPVVLWGGIPWDPRFDTFGISPGTHRVSFACFSATEEEWVKGTIWNAAARWSAPAVWKSEGFEVHVTQGPIPAELSDSTPAPGAQETTTAGAPAGPNACPAVDGESPWQGVEIQLSNVEEDRQVINENVVRYGYDLDEPRIAAMATFTFEVPPDRNGFQPGEEVWVDVVCRTSAFADSTPTEFLYASARATIGVGGSDALRLDRQDSGLNKIEPVLPEPGRPCELKSRRTRLTQKPTPEECGYNGGTWLLTSGP